MFRCHSSFVGAFKILKGMTSWEGRSLRFESLCNKVFSYQKKNIMGRFDIIKY